MTEEPLTNWPLACADLTPHLPTQASHNLRLCVRGKDLYFLEFCVAAERKTLRRVTLSCTHSPRPAVAIYVPKSGTWKTVPACPVVLTA